MSYRSFPYAGFLALVIAAGLTGCATQVRTARIVYPDATINGKPTRLAMDTGAGMNWILSSEAERLGLKSTRIAVEDSSTSRGLSEGARLVAERQIVEAPFATVTLPWAARLVSGIFFPSDITGAIGWPAMRDNIVVFDAARRTASRVEELPPETATWTKLKIRRDAQLFLEIPFPDGTTYAFMVDTGAPCGVLLPPELWDRWHQANPEVRTRTRFGWTLGVKQMKRTKHAMADEIQLGPVRLRNVQVSHDVSPGQIRPTKSGKLAAAIPAAGDSAPPPVREGMLGLFAFERMDLIVDGKNGFAYLRPRPPHESPRRAKHLPWRVADNVRLDPGPQLAFAAETLGAIKQREGDLPAAIEEFTRALQFDPHNPELFVRRANAKGNNGDAEGAIADATQALALAPDVTSALLVRGNAFMNKGDIDRARMDLDRALEIDPKHGGAYVLRGMTRLITGDFAGAAADADRALQIDPSTAAAFNIRGLSSLFRNEFAAGIVDLGHAIKIEPRNAALYAARSVAKSELGDRKGADADLRRALKLDPKISLPVVSTKIALEVGDGLQSRGDFAGALAQYEKLIALNAAGVIDATLRRQVLLRRLGQPAADLSKVAAGWKDGWKQTLAGFVSGNVSEETVLNHISEGKDQDLSARECEAFYYIGVIRLLNGDQIGAREAWQKCLNAKYEETSCYQLILGELRRLNNQTPAG